MFIGARAIRESPRCGTLRAMPATDNFSRFQVGDNNEYRNAVAVTPHDTNELANVTRAIYIGGGSGALKVDLVDSGTVTFSGLVTGTVLPVRAKKVYSTGTSATNIIALW